MTTATITTTPTSHARAVALMDAYRATLPRDPDLTGKERVSRKPSVPHPMIEELAARMELNRLIEAANAMEVAA